MTRLAAVPPFALGFVLLCLLSSALDRIDPTAGQVERTAGLFLLAFAVSGVVVALLRGTPSTPQVQTALAGLLVRGALLLVSALLLVLLLTGSRLNPLGDLQFLVGLPLLALIALPWAYDPSSRVDAFLARWAVPVGSTAFLLGLPVLAVKVAALP